MPEHVRMKIIDTYLQTNSIIELESVLDSKCINCKDCKVKGGKCYGRNKKNV